MTTTVLEYSMFQLQSFRWLLVFCDDFDTAP